MRTGAKTTLELERLTLDKLMSRISRELEVNAILASDCQAVISEIAPSHMSDSVIERLQGVDLLSQTLVELARLLNRAVAACPADLTLSDNLLVSVRLAALRDRLAGKASESVDQGDPELW
jgi:hypothetical protein